MKSALVALAWVSVAAALLAFFLPWVTLDLREPPVADALRAVAEPKGAHDDSARPIGRMTVEIRQGTKTIAGDLPTLSDIPRTISGAQLPRIANQPSAKVALALLELFTPKARAVETNIAAVYLVPSVAFLCGVLVTACSRTRVLLVGVSIVCAAIAAAGAWKLLTIQLHMQIVTLFIIGSGLWISLWAYAGLALAAGILSLAPDGRQVSMPKIDTPSSASL